jgi:hypothetical protein
MTVFEYTIGLSSIIVGLTVARIPLPIADHRGGVGFQWGTHRGGR